MVKRVYKIQDHYAIGVFDGDELLKGASPKYFKTKMGAERALKKLLS
jgi:hypothetical protein